MEEGYVDKYAPGDEIKAERFDFTFTEHFYKHNIHIDEYGERMIS